ncbi:PREDICTED: uncharacterized protein LOC108377531 isoform X1 [Rhagoletis zephyria]|uniref:uncharacterized protein LOC108377531 isoform X1 n=1 Tax=Rhagoletis zephyria TaxID=28612 RepID=UPI00081148DA|nr:PREDICTED: uncharacterized protein LOC108377531 isoform X1 [Rhagoletis zephyria]
MTNRNETMAQNRLMRECKIILAKVQQSVGKMTGDIVDEAIVEVASVLPLFTIDAAMEVEEKLNEHEYATAMVIFTFKTWSKLITYFLKQKTHIHTLKGASGDVDPVMRKLFADELLYFYNWDGRKEKKALSNLNLVNQILFDVFVTKGRLQFEKEVKKAVELSHNRFKHKKAKV